MKGKGKRPVKFDSGLSLRCKAEESRRELSSSAPQMAAQCQIPSTDARKITWTASYNVCTDVRIFEK
jgi:hypothetical protein